MKQFFVTLPRNLVGCFRGRMIIWHIVAIVLTVILVMSGADWSYFHATRSPVLRSWMWPAVRIGGRLPILLPLFLIALGILVRSAKIARTGWALGQAVLLAALIVVAYKVFTGRAHPPHNAGADLTHVFRFGFLRGGVFWGWPSSHTAIAFAMGVTVFTMYPKQKWLGCLAIVYALYIGVGVSMTIHWFSDFVAGTIVGSVVGRVVGRSFGLNPSESRFQDCQSPANPGK